MPEYCSTSGSINDRCGITRRACVSARARLCTAILVSKSPPFVAWHGDDAKCTHVFVLKSAKGCLLFF